MENEEYIITQAKSGDLFAFKQLVEAYSARLYTAAFRILGEKSLAEDCVQEVFIKLHRKITSFDAQAKFSTWLYSVTVNTAIDLQRKQAKHQQEIGEGLEHVACKDSYLQEKNIWLNDISAQTHAALMQLNEDTRMAFLLRHYEERSIEEISQITQTNPNTVKNRIFRAVARLSEILKPRVGEHETFE